MSNIKDFLKKTAKLATKQMGYPASKGKYFLGSLPLGTVFETDRCKGILLDTSVNARVQVFDVFGLEDRREAKNMVGKTIWAWATEVSIIKLGQIKEEKDEPLD